MREANSTNFSCPPSHTQCRGDEMSGDDDDFNPWMIGGILAGVVVLICLLFAMHKSRAGSRSKPKFKSFEMEDNRNDAFISKGRPPAPATAPAKTATSSLGYVL